MTAPRRSWQELKAIHMDWARRMETQPPDVLKMAILDAMIEGEGEDHEKARKVTKELTRDLDREVKTIRSAIPARVDREAVEHVLTRHLMRRSGQRQRLRHAGGKTERRDLEEGLATIRKTVKRLQRTYPWMLNLGWILWLTDIVLPKDIEAFHQRPGRPWWHKDAERDLRNLGLSRQESVLLVALARLAPQE